MTLVTKTVFDGLEPRNRNQVASNVIKTSVTAAKLGPDFDFSFFREVKPDQ